MLSKKLLLEDDASVALVLIFGDNVETDDTAMLDGELSDVVPEVEEGLAEVAIVEEMIDLFAWITLVLALAEVIGTEVGGEGVADVKPLRLVVTEV